MNKRQITLALNVLFWLLFFFTADCFYWAALYWTSVKSLPLVYAVIRAMDMWLYFTLGLVGMVLVQTAKAHPDVLAPLGQLRARLRTPLRKPAVKRKKQRKQVEETEEELSLPL